MGFKSNQWSSIRIKWRDIISGDPLPDQRPLGSPEGGRRGGGVDRGSAEIFAFSCTRTPHCNLTLLQKIESCTEQVLVIIEDDCRSRAQGEIARNSLERANCNLTQSNDVSTNRTTTAHIVE